MKRIALLLLALPLVFTAVMAKPKPKAPAAPPYPAYFTAPASLVAPNADVYHYEDFGEASFWKKEETFTKQGKHWQADLVWKDPPAKADGKAIWALIKPSMVAGGWQITDEYDDNPFSAMMHYVKDGKDSWAYMKLFAPDDIRLNIIEVGTGASDFVLTPPAAVPEKVDAVKGDFPYLTPLPNSTYGSGTKETGTMEVTLQGSDEPQTVGTGYIVKFYKKPLGLSNLSFVTTYVNALTKAGWTIVEKSENTNQSDATITAHYSKNGRDVWTYMHNGGEEYSIKVADNGGADALSASLAKMCHVALLGVLFDFNKATLKPESDPVLQKVLALLQKNATLKLEVQGHTDNVGGDAYNQTLSESRAKSVMAWLTQHGIAAARLTFKGYGKTMPVASNDNDEGRAKNRRVEIANPACKSK